MKNPLISLLGIAWCLVLSSNFHRSSGNDLKFNINHVKETDQSGLVEASDPLERSVSRSRGEDVTCYQPEPVNNRPIIGILAQESNSTYGDTYFMATSVRFAEMAGARVVPISINESNDYYSSLFRSLNGVIFPGGSVSLTDSGYAKAARIIYKLAKEANAAGDYFPLLGFCLGHELLTVLETGSSWVTECDAEGLMLPLNMAPGGLASRLFSKAPPYVLDVITKYNVATHMHKFCITPQNFTKSGLDKSFRIVTTNKDRNGLEFVSMMEAIQYPFYGSQWHAEKIPFIWDLSFPLNHTQGAVRVSQYIADFFVQEARRSRHHFPDEASEGAVLIQNYHPVYEGPPTFNLIYYFNLTKSSASQKNQA